MIWSPAIHLYAALLERFGDAKFLAARKVMSHDAALSLRRFLARLEAMLRDVLMRLAAKLPETKARPIWRVRRRAKPAPAGRPGFANEDPAAWGVSFPLAAHRSGAGGHGQDRLPPLFVSSTPLAERLEAIARVFADPAPYIRRAALLARRPLRSPDEARAKAGARPGGQRQTLRPPIPGPRIAAMRRPGSGEHLASQPALPTLRERRRTARSAHADDRR